MGRLIACLAVVAAVAAAGCDMPGAGELVDETSAGVREDGFPCDVRAVLQAHCAECHTGNYYTVSFNSRAVWLSKWSDGMTFGQHAAMRVAAETMPPPNAAAQPTEGERALLLDWVAAGMPPGACEPLTRPPLR